MHFLHSSLFSCRVLSLAIVISPLSIRAQTPDVRQIIEKSVQANQADFKAATQYNWKERDRTAKADKTYQVTMLEGSPYYRVLELRGEPVSAEVRKEEGAKQKQTEAKRHSESSTERQKRMQKFQKERRRDDDMMSQLTKAFDFTYIGQQKLNGFDVWAFKAIPRAGYKPPNMETEVLPGMQGQLWIDQKTYQWVKVTAQVVRPVSVAGFLAQVQPGTQFNLEKKPVENGIWLASHFSMKSDAKVLHMFSRTHKKTLLSSITRKRELRLERRESNQPDSSIRSRVTYGRRGSNRHVQLAFRHWEAPSIRSVGLPQKCLLTTRSASILLRSTTVSIVFLRKVHSKVGANLHLRPFVSR